MRKFVVTLSLISLGLFSCKKQEKENSTQTTNEIAANRASDPTYIVYFANGSRSEIFSEDVNDSTFNHEYEYYDSLGSSVVSLTGEYYTNPTEESFDITILENGNPVQSFSGSFLSFPGDCSKLGGRKTSESFSDCFQRNMENFCCDIPSCGSLAVAPEAVAIGVALGCAIKPYVANPLPEDYVIMQIVGPGGASIYN